jgi:PmbA protein
MAFDADSQAALAALLDHVRKFGADSAEASLASRESLSVDVRLGELEGVEREEGRSVALRAFVGKRQAAASSTDLSDKGLAALAERVAEMAKAAPEDPYCGLLEARWRAQGPWPELEQSDTARPDAGALLAKALECEAAAMAVPGVVNSGGGGASSDAAHFVFATSDGFEGAESATSYALGVQPIAERDGKMERDYEYRTRRFLNDLPGAAEIGRIAGERTARRLGPRKIASTRCAVVFESRLAGSLLGPLFGGMSGAAVARGTSFIKDKLGQRIFADGFRIEEDPFQKRGLGSRAFDGEGCAVKARALIEDGVLTTWLLNASTARQLKMDPTGHANAGHGGPPGIGASNLVVKAGEHDQAGLMASAGKGVLITDMFSPSLNMNNGDWSVGVAGFWFENGAIAYPVSEITVAGNLIDIYARLIPGADLDRRGALTAPSFLVDDLAIGGV